MSQPSRQAQQCGPRCGRRSSRLGRAALCGLSSSKALMAARVATLGRYYQNMLNRAQPETAAHLRMSSRGSGTATMPTFGSMVQKGKLAACALPFSHSALNMVDCGAQRNHKCVWRHSSPPGQLQGGACWHRAWPRKGGGSGAGAPPPGLRQVGAGQQRRAHGAPAHLQLRSAPCRRWAGPQCRFSGP